MRITTRERHGDAGERSYAAFLLRDVRFELRAKGKKVSPWDTCILAAQKFKPMSQGTYNAIRGVAIQFPATTWRA